MRPEDQIPFGPPEEPIPPPEASPQLRREQRLGRYRDLITNFTYDLGRGLQAASQNPRGRAQRTQAGIGAILTAPLALQQAQQQMRASQQDVTRSQEEVLASQQQRESQAQSERRKQMAGEILSQGGTFEDAYGKLIRAGLMTEALQFKKEWQQQQNDESMSQKRTVDALKDSVAPTMQIPGEVYPPQASGAEMYQAPDTAAPAPLRTTIGGQSVEVPSLQMNQYAEEQKAIREARLQQETDRAQRAGFTLSAGQERRDADGKLIASRPAEATGGGAADQDWVIRNGVPTPIRKGAAQPGDTPYDAVAARASSGADGPSPYTAERAARTVVSVNELIPLVGPTTVGFGAWLKNVPSSAALAFSGKLDTLKANIAFNELTAMREASKTGGALGQIAVRELELLQSALGSLDQRQDKESFTAQLNKIKASVERWQKAQARSPVKPPTATAPSGVDQSLWDVMTPEERALWQN